MNGLVPLVAFKLELALCTGLTLLYLALLHFPPYFRPSANG
jgi:hypothetical protein